MPSSLRDAGQQSDRRGPQRPEVSGKITEAAHWRNVLLTADEYAICAEGRCSRRRRRISRRIFVVRRTTMNYMSRTTQKPFSIRMSERVLERLDSGARHRGEPKARTAERLIDEGLRMEDHPGIIFRDGPAGRRAALAAGPDVWEVIETLRGTGLTGEQAIAATAAWGALTVAQVRTGVDYYAEFRAEVDERIALNRNEVERLRALSERALDAIA